MRIYQPGCVLPAKRDKNGTKKVGREGEEGMHVVPLP